MKHVYMFITFSLITAMTSGCGPDKNNKSWQTLTLLSLTHAEPVEPIPPDPEYTGSDCGCGVKTSGGSFMSVSLDIALAGYANSSKRLQKAYVPGEILVKFRTGVSSNVADRVLKKFGASRVRDIVLQRKGAGPFMKHIRLNDKSVEKAVAEYSASPEVEHAQPNYIYHAFATHPDDPDYGSQWGVHNTGQFIGENAGISGKDINAPEAWDVITDCGGVIVAVVDSGVNYNQRDLAGNMWNGGASYPHHGYNFSDNNDDPIDHHGHGTHVAGIIGASGNDGAGLCGVCWKVRLMAVKVLDAAGDGSTATIVSGINFAVANGAHVINLSLGISENDAALKAAIEAARAGGVIVVASAGNSNSTAYQYPAAYTNTSKCSNCDNVISVGAIDQRGNLASFSNYGTDWVDIAAPGVRILSAWAGQSITTRENFRDWERGRGWGVDDYPFQGPFGPIYITLLTNPSRFGRSRYNAKLTSATYKTFDLGAYGAASARVDFYLDYNFFSGDSMTFTANTDGAIPNSSDEIMRVTGSSDGLMNAGGYDMTKYIGPHTSMGFLFMTKNDFMGTLGAGIGFFETTRLYLNTTSCLYLDGTSMAAPHVSGVAALCIAQYMNKYGTYTPASNYLEIINAILNNYDYYASLNYKISNGRMLNAAKAVGGI